MTQQANFPFQNPDLQLEVRVQDLVSRLTLEEKVELMCQYQAEIPHLGIQKYKHGTEGAHGVAWLGEATVFPQNIGLACTWNPSLMKEIGSIIGDETRVYYQRDKAINGLTVWAPTVDMERDPRWGRTEEAYGEDPVLTGKLASALVQGMQGDHPFYYKTVATLKHFLGNNNEVDRGEASVSIDPRNMREYYLKAFEAPFREGGAASMMTAYNGINGVPANLNHDVQHIVKDEWGMNGFVVGDAGDVLGTVNDHYYCGSYAEAVAGSVKAGIDSITDEQDISFQALRDALEQGLLVEADLDKALTNTFRVRMRLGEFDPEERNPYANMPESKLCAPEHAAKSKQAAQESVVLLKNNGILPLNREVLNKVAVIGPLAGFAYTDWYSGTPAYKVSPLEGIEAKMAGKQVSYEEGIDRVILRSAKDDTFVGLADTEQRELKLGSSAREEAEVFDRTDWGWGSETLKARTTGKFVTEGETSLNAVAEEARGWFVKEAFQLDLQANGKTLLKSWEGKAVGVKADQTLAVAHDGADAEATSFYVDTVHQGLEEAIRAAKAADTAIVFVGNSPFINGKETIDRPDITLPPVQEALIRAVYEANPNTIVVVVGSYPYAVNWANEHVPAIVYTSHAGQELGNAVADVLFGDYNPAGRLNMTWYKSVDQLPEFMDYDIIQGKRTYQYFDGEALYPFGHGLSYTSFAYSNLQLSAAEIAGDGTLQITVDVTNTGSYAGDEVVQLYIHANASRVTRPIKTLRDFTRIHLQAGACQTVTFQLKASDLAIWDVTRERYCVEKGIYTIMAGSSSNEIHLQESLFIHGEVIPPRKLDTQVRAVNYDAYHQVELNTSIEGGTCIRTKQDANGKGETKQDISWIAFKEVDLSAKPVQFKARVATLTNYVKRTELEIRLDAPDGPLAGAITLMPTGGLQAWTTIQTVLSEMSGTHDVYITIKGSLQLSWFEIK